MNTIILMFITGLVVWRATAYWYDKNTEIEWEWEFEIDETDDEEKDGEV